MSFFLFFIRNFSIGEMFQKIVQLFDVFKIVIYTNIEREHTFLHFRIVMIPIFYILYFTLLFISFDSFE